MRILISGASGFIGSPLSSFLESQGHTVIPLLRINDQPLSLSVVWNPEKREATLSDFEGFDVVIHLAGEPLTLNHWSEEKKERILSSRTKSTLFLTHLLSCVDRPPELFLTASAIGYYGDRKEEVLTEESLPGSGFLPNVCKAWEKATSNSVMRTVNTRFGMVLGARGGALQRMLLPFKFGFGGSLGTGKQWQSWIALADLMRAIDWIIQNKEIKGPVNFVSPKPVRQKEFAKTLATLLHRPSFFPIPGFVLRWLYGIVADELLLSSAYVQPTKLLASNFIFNYSDLRSALLWALEPS